ncbi:MAG TPA: hypothetical protein VJC12_01385 [Candidatus Paceibacterota bacterium]
MIKSYRAPLLLLVMFFLAPAFIFAGEISVAKNVSLQKETVVNDDFYAFGNNSAISGEVMGDLITLGLNVFSSGSVSEDAFIIGANANVFSKIKGDLRLIGAKTYFGGETGKDLVVLAQEIQILPEAKIGRDFIAQSGRVVINGAVSGKVKIGGGHVYINAEIGQDADITANNIVLGPQAQISGNFSYSSRNSPQIQEGAQIGGEIIVKPIKAQSRLEKILPTVWGTWGLIHFAILLLSALILHGFFRNISTRFVSQSIHHFWHSLLRGFIFVIAVPILIVLVFLTFIGIPFGLLGIALYTLVLVFAYVYAPVVTGSLLYHLFKIDEAIVVNWKTIIIGVIITIIFSYIPYIGPILKYGLLLVALGGIYRVLYDKFIETR